MEGGSGLTHETGLDRDPGDDTIVFSPADAPPAEADPPPADGARATPAPLLPLDEARSPDPRVCPFFRFVDADGRITAPRDDPHPGNHCAAFGEPEPQSARQQELVCLRSAHANCPRYLRGMLVEPRPLEAPTRSRLSRATTVAALVLLLSAGVSVGFVLQRGGIVLPLSAAEPDATTTAAQPTGAPMTQPPEATAPPATAVVTAPPATPAPTSAPATPPPATPAPTPPPRTPAPTPPPRTPAPTPRATPVPTTAGTGTGTASRYALLEPCPDAPSCWIYTVRPGDNFTSIVNWFGVPYDTVIGMNPGLGDPTTIQPGDRIRMPPPTR